MIKVSIIVPIYNSANYLKKCIDSLLNQTEKNIEVLLVNDGSTDNSEEIIKKYQDERITYISKKNEGIGKTRNLGIDKAQGEYLMFIDSDDYIREDCVEKMLFKAESDHCDLVISDFLKDYEDHFDEVIIPSFEDTSLRNKPDILNNINLGPCNKLYKRELIGNTRFVENLKYEDVTFVIEVLKNAKRIGKVNDFLSYYVIHGGSETTTRDKRVFDIIEVNREMQSILKDEVYKKAFLDLSVTILLDYAIQTRYIADRSIRHSFVDSVFKRLNEIDINWKKSNSLKESSLLKKLIKTNKLLTIIYVDLSSIRYCKKG